MGYYCRNYLHAYQPRTMLTASVYGTLGCVYPIALGKPQDHRWRLGCILPD